MGPVFFSPMEFKARLFASSPLDSTALLRLSAYVFYLYASGIFPLNIRMLCVAITTATTWLGSFVVARSTPFMITDLRYGAYFFFSTALVLMGLWACIIEL